MEYSKVVYLKTSPETVREDIGRLMRLVSYTDSIGAERDTILGIDLSWHHFYPGTSSTPWQIDGVIGALLADGFDSRRILPFINADATVRVRFGEILNRHRMAVERHGLSLLHPGAETVAVSVSVDSDHAKHTVNNLNGVHIPSAINNSNIVLLPTMKTHHDITIAGAVYTAYGVLFGGEKRERRARFHESLVDTLAVLKKACPGVLAVMDGTFAGEGPGPMRMIPHVKNIIAASTDPLALDAVAAHLMGFDPLEIPYIRMAHEAGLGIGDPQMIDIVGETVPGGSFGFSAKGSSMDDFLWKLETSRVSLGYRLSQMYTDWYWMLNVGEKRMKTVMKSGWGALFETYRK